MKFRTGGLTSLLLSTLIGCTATSERILMVRHGKYISVKSKNENCFYHHLPIRNTGYYVIGEGASGFLAEFNAEQNLNRINEYGEPAVSDLEDVDRMGKIRWIIESEECRELRIIMALRGIQSSVIK